MKTTDLCDKYGEWVKVAERNAFRNFGRIAGFYGTIETVKCFEDNSVLRAALEQEGAGKVLVVDGGGSLRCALLGEDMASLAHANKWSGILVNGCIRDSAEVSKIDIGILALGTSPRRSNKRNEGTAGGIVHFAGTDFVPANHIYIDADGIVTSEKELALPG